MKKLNTFYEKMASHWTVQDLVVLGVFSAGTKISTLLVTIMAGGPNPIGFIVKNLIFTLMLIIMLYKVRKAGTLILFVCINMIISMLLLGASVTFIPTAFGAAFLAELLIYIGGGINKKWGVVLGVAVYDFSSKIFSLGMTWLFARENPAIIAPFVIILAIGYIGSIWGLFAGVKAVKELEHAGIIR